MYIFNVCLYKNQILQFNLYIRLVYFDEYWLNAYCLNFNRFNVYYFD